MILATVSPLLEGKILARSIFGEGGEVLLIAGARLTAGYIGRLASMGVSRVYISDGQFEDVEVQDAVSDRTREMGLRAMADLARQSEGHKRLEAASATVGKAVDAIIADVMSNPLTVAACADLKSYDEYTYQHSVNTCVIALQMGRKAGLRGDKLRDLGLGAFLHDVGKMRIPIDVLNKPGRLEPQEFEIIKDHSRFGWDDLKGMLGVGPVARSASLQHHERFDGKGYPKGLSGQEISWVARYVSVADVFDALTSDRPYRASLPNYTVLQEYLQVGNPAFDPAVVEILHRIACPYPPGSIVMLSNGIQAVVLSATESQLSRPIVRGVGDPTGEIDLSIHNDIQIVGPAQSQTV